MSDSLVETVKTVLRCRGVLVPNEFTAHETHETKLTAVAEAVVEALGLTQETGSIYGKCNCGNESDQSWCDDDCNRRKVDHYETRFVTSWQAVTA